MKHLSIIILLSLSFLCSACQSGESSYTQIDEYPIDATPAKVHPASDNEITARSSVSDMLSSQEDTTEKVFSESMVVAVLGEVYSPGIYSLPEGSRIYELINAAGGLTEQADISEINLVSKITDGTQITIPSLSENEKKEKSDLIKTDTPDKAYEGKISVNINTASLQTLTTIPGIGATRAEAIIKYREEAGGFGKPEDIMNVPGIKEGTYDKIKAYITVG